MVSVGEGTVAECVSEIESLREKNETLQKRNTEVRTSPY